MDIENAVTEEKYAKMAEQLKKGGCDDRMIEKFIRQETEADEFRKRAGTTDMEAVRLWNSYPDEAKAMWLNNAFCINCGVASFRRGFNLRKDRFGVVIEGTCDKCGGRIARCCD